MKLESEKLIERHEQLVHSEMRKVVSHVQREAGQWIINTVMADG